MSFLKRFIFNICFLFCLLAFLFLPLTLNSHDYQFQICVWLFKIPVSIIQNYWFPEAIKTIDFSSDTIGLNLLLVLLLIISIITISILKIFRVNIHLIEQLFFKISPYYLGLILLKYGLDKVTLQQFTIPEPNILYTPFGYLDKDILFWSTIGTSKFYNISVGIIEIIVSLLLFSRKTRLLGFCFSLCIILNILIINLGFDISVKTLIILLLFVILLNLIPFLKPLFTLFIKNKAVPLDYQNDDLVFPYQRFIKIILLILIIGFVSYPYFIDLNSTSKPITAVFHKAYEVKGDQKSFKRVFFHKNSFIIFQTQKDEMIDYHYNLDTSLKKLILQDYENNQIEVKYEMDKNGMIKLQMKDDVNLLLSPINWKNLPALKDGFHYTIDEIK